MRRSALSWPLPGDATAFMLAHRYGPDWNVGLTRRDVALQDEARIEEALEGHRFAAISPPGRVPPGMPRFTFWR
jgi:hypothetical protein